MRLCREHWGPWNREEQLIAVRNARQKDRKTERQAGRIATKSWLNTDDCPEKKRERDVMRAGECVSVWVCECVSEQPVCNSVEDNDHSWATLCTLQHWILWWRISFTITSTTLHLPHEYITSFGFDWITLNWIWLLFNDLLDISVLLITHAFNLYIELMNWYLNIWFLLKCNCINQEKRERNIEATRWPRSDPGLNPEVPHFLTITTICG